MRYPRWLVEGYADFIAKDGAFDFEENLQLLRAGDRLLSYEDSGLYRRYHLMTAFLIEERGKSVNDLFAAPPDENDVLDFLLRPAPGEKNSAASPTH